MKRNTRKGFTGIELVIVIAIIAILASALIPTFSGLFKSARLTNDKSFVRNANATLLAEGLGGNIKTAGDAIDALSRNGFAGKFNTYSTNYHYCYSIEKNQMYLLDDNDEIVFPEQNVEKSTLWGLYTDNRTSVVSGVTKYVAMSNITNSAHYDVFANGTYTIDLNGYFVAVDSDCDVTAINGIVIKGATAGEGVNTGYELIEALGYTSTASSDYYKSFGVEDNGTITISNKIIANETIVHLFIDDKNVVFDNCVFYGNRVQLEEANGYTGYKVTFQNCQFTDITAWAILANGSVEVIDCTFTSLLTRGAVQVQENSEDINVKISGCTFDGTSGEYPMIRFVGRNDETKLANGIASVEISNCNFIALNKSIGIIGFSGTRSDLYNYAGSDAIEINFSNNTVNSDITEDKYVVNAGADNTLGELFAASVK